LSEVFLGDAEIGSLTDVHFFVEAVISHEPTLTLVSNDLQLAVGEHPGCFVKFSTKSLYFDPHIKTLLCRLNRVSSGIHETDKTTIQSRPAPTT